MVEKEKCLCERLNEEVLFKDSLLERDDIYIEIYPEDKFNENTKYFLGTYKKKYYNGDGEEIFKEYHTISISFCPFCGRKLEEEKEGDYDKLAYLNDDIKEVAKGLKNSNRHIDFIEFFKQNLKGFIKFEENFANNFDAGEWYSYEFFEKGSKIPYLTSSGYFTRDEDLIGIDNVGLIPLYEVLKVEFEVKK